MAVACAAATGIAMPAAALDAPAENGRAAIEVTASIAERCGVSPDRLPLTSASLDRAERMAIGFNIDCNTPFVIGLSSEHGAWRLAGATGSGNDGGFAVEKDYDVSLAVETDQGQLDGGTCSSRSLAAGAASRCDFYGTAPGEGLGSGERTAIRRTGTVTIAWPADDSDGVRRAAGTYRDTITIVVGVRS